VHKISDLRFQDVFDGRLGDIEEAQNVAEQSGQLGRCEEAIPILLASRRVAVRNDKLRSSLNRQAANSLTRAR